MNDQNLSNLADAAEARHPLRLEQAYPVSGEREQWLHLETYSERVTLAERHPARSSEKQP